MAERVVDISPAKPRRSMLDPSEFDYKVEIITPDKAKEYLLANTRNRSMSKRTVQRYVRDIQSGNWEFCGDPIRFNGKGGLIDGQHRLKAIDEAGVAVPCLVIRGLGLDVQEKIDQGYKRQAADHLHMRDIPNSITAAATARFLFWLKNKDADRSIGFPTNSEVLSVFDRHPKLPDSLSVTGKAVGVHPSVIVGMHYIGSRLLSDTDTADAFAGVFASGEPTYDGDPAHLWRERLFAQAKSKYRLRQRSMRIGTIHAWNLFRRKEPLKIFRLPDDANIEGLDVARL